MADDARDPMGDLADAVEAYRARVHEGAAEPEEEFLKRHASVRDILESMLREGALATGKSSASEPPVEGRMLGGFRLVREIGRGGMGVVYEAEQIALRRRVALKVLPAHLTRQAESVLRFRNEASMAARLRHPGIVEIHFVGEEAGTHFFAMELVEGKPLDRAIDEMRADVRADGSKIDAGAVFTSLGGSALAPARDPKETSSSGRATTSASTSTSNRNRGYIETVCRLAAQVADALEHAHRAGVIHRDVKPANILVRGNGTAVVTDFGIAREEGLPSLTATGAFAGTPYYVSPEQVTAGRGRIDARTDVYSLGVTLYELLTLRRPFEGESTQEILGKILNVEPASPRRWNPVLPRDLETIVMKAIEKDPARRYARAADMAADLRAFLEFRPIAAKPASLGTRVWKLARRNRAATVSGALVSAACVAAAVVWLLQPATLELRSSTAGASVFIDGALRGKTAGGDAPIRIALAPGMHSIRLEKLDEELVSDETQVLLSRGASTLVEPRLASLRGVVELASNPSGARVTLVDDDGREQAAPGSTRTMMTCLPGRYRARFELEGFGVKELPLEVHSGGQRTECTATWETGNLALQSDRAGIEVEIYAGDHAGVGAPIRTCTLPIAQPLRLPAGTYSLRARLVDHDRRDREGSEAVRVDAGGTVKAQLWLPPVQRVVEARLGGAIRDLVIADLDGCGNREAVVAADTGEVVAFGADGARRAALNAGAEITALARDEKGSQSETRVLVGTATGEILVGSAQEPLHPIAKMESGVNALATADLDGDGSATILAGDQSGRLVAYAPDASRRFTREPDRFPVRAVAGDLDGSGRSVVFMSRWSGHSELLEASGATRFVPHLRGRALHEAFPRFDRSGARDLVVATDQRQLAAFRRDGSARFAMDMDDWVRQVASVDLDGDGVDEVVATSASGQILAIRADGSQLFESRADGDVFGLDVADLDGDGRLEILVATRNGRLLALDADGTRRFESAGLDSVGWMRVADLDGDGRPEIALANGNGQLAVLALDLDVRFEKGTKGDACALAIGDLSGNGETEILTGTRAGQLLKLQRDGAPTGEWDSDVWVGTETLAELDGDGRKQSVTTCSTGRVLARERDGSIRWDERLAAAPTAVVDADLDGDGHHVLLFGDPNGALIAIAGDGARRMASSAMGGISGIVTFKETGSRPEILVGTHSSTVEAFDADGTRLWFADAPGEICSVARLPGRNEVLLGMDDGSIVPFSPSTRAFGRPWIRLESPVVRLAVGALDRSGRLGVAAGTLSGRLVVLSDGGEMLSTRRLHGEIYAVAMADLDGDGRSEVLIAAGNLDRIVVSSPPQKDPRREQRRAFLEGLDAVERGDESAAAVDFDRARLRWLTLDDTGLGMIRQRLHRAASSPSARRIVETLDRIRPSTFEERRALLCSLVESNDLSQADALIRSDFSAPREDLLTANILNRLAWSLVSMETPTPEAAALGMKIAEAGVKASGGRDANLLDTLAESLFKCGRVDEALALEEKALATCPPSPPGSPYLRPAIEKSLVRFRAAVDSAPAPAPASRKAP